MILPIFIILKFIGLASASSSLTSSPCCSTNACSRGIEILQMKNFGPDSWVVGNGLEEYSWMTGAGNGTLSGGSIFCSSNAVCFLQSNELFNVPCKDELQLQGSLNFQATSIGGPITSPFGIDEDPFYGYGSLGFIDPKDGFVFEYRFTNNMTYAVYGRVPETETECSSFLFLIPVGPMNEYACATFDIVLKKCTGVVSYRIGGKEVLRITVGEKVDEKFKVYGFDETCGCGCPCIGEFPERVYVRVGNGAMNSVDCCTTQSQPACQRTVFNECLDDIHCACRVNCTYAPAQPNLTFNVGLASLYKSVAVMASKEVTVCERGCSTSDSTENSLSSLPCEQNFQCRRERRQRLIDNIQHRLN